MLNNLRLTLSDKFYDIITKAKLKFGRCYLVTVRCYLYKQYWNRDTNGCYDREMFINYFSSYLACKVAEIYAKQDPLVEKVMVIRCVIRKKN